MMQAFVDFRSKLPSDIPVDKKDTIDIPVGNKIQLIFQ